MVDCSFLAPLDFECLFVNTLSGTWTIFSALALFAIASISGFFRMGGVIFGASVLLFAIFMVQYIPWLLITTLIIGGLVIFLAISYAINR